MRSRAAAGRSSREEQRGGAAGSSSGEQQQGAAAGSSSKESASHREVGGKHAAISPKQRDHLEHQPLRKLLPLRCLVPALRLKKTAGHLCRR